MNVNNIRVYKSMQFEYDVFKLCDIFAVYQQNI